MLPFLLLLLAGAARPCAGQVVPADTARHSVQLPVAPVEGLERMVVPLSLPPQETDEPSFLYAEPTSINAEALARLGAGTTLASALAQLSPLAIRQYGPGQLASLSVRGTGPQHVAVVWQGFNLNFPTLGQADLSLLPVAPLAGATLTQGPQAARYGSGAVGGALTLTTRSARTPYNELSYKETPMEGERRVRYNGLQEGSGWAAVGGGSFGQRTFSGGGSMVFGDHSFSTTAQVSRASNDFPYRYRTFRGWQESRQANAATESYSVTHEHVVRISDAVRLTAAAWLTGADRQIAPALNTPNTDARQHDASQRAVVSVAFRDRATLRLASLTDVINYADNLTGPSDSRSQSWQGQLETTTGELTADQTHTWWYRHGLKGRGGVELQHFRARADGYGPGLKTEQRAAAYGELEWRGGPRIDSSSTEKSLSALLTIRRAVLPGGRAPLTPSVRLSWQPNVGRAEWAKNDFEIWGEAARAFRAPTLNERYWRVGGNPDLSPEASRGFQLGVKWGNIFRSIWAQRPTYHLQATAFDQHITDWVQWTPNALTGIWSPRNLRRVRSRGVEATGQLHLYGRLRQSVPQPKTSLILAGQVLETQKTAGAPTDPDPVGIQLPYVPTHTGSLTLRHERTHQTRQLLSYFRPTAPDEYAPRRTLTLNADASAVVFSRRTTNASGTETLPAYGLLNAGTSLRYELTGHPVVFNLRLDCLNLLNTEYQSQTNRPMPGRSWQITLGLAYR